MTRFQMVVIPYLLLLTLFVPCREAAGQLLSPGKLSTPHGELEGLLKCQSCHELRKPGASNSKCLECHKPLRNRMDERRGYHATVAAKACSSCHSEHRGRDVPLTELDTIRFDHTQTGFTLVARHAEATCRECHQVDFITALDVRSYKGKHGSLDRTMLGLGTACTTCHDRDDPHTNQFAERGCEDCHSEFSWEQAERFDHNRTRYRLTGRHLRTECADCHKATRTRDGKLSIHFAPLKFAGCESCHRDEHEGSLGANCTRCHTARGWHRVQRSAVEDRFDHSNTEFPLAGKHANLECSACHVKGDRHEMLLRITVEPATRQFAYPLPVADACTSCHLDYHRRAFVKTSGGSLCDNCHNEQGWDPALYDVKRHNSDAAFTLRGAHLATPCTECHPAPDEGKEAEQFRISEDNCGSCHENEDPHRSQFSSSACNDCHDSRAFTIEDFDHDSTRYALDGAHQEVPCISCHQQERDADGLTFQRYRPLGTGCRDCHAGETGRG